MATLMPAGIVDIIENSVPELFSWAKDALSPQDAAIPGPGQLEVSAHEIAGVNSRLDPVQAAMLAVKLAHLDAWNDRRRDIARRYAEAFRDTDLILPAPPQAADPVWHLYVLRSGDPNWGVGGVTAYHLNARNVANMVFATRMEMRPNDIVFIEEQPITKWNRALQQAFPMLLGAAQNAVR